MEGSVVSQIIRYVAILVFIIVALIGFDRSYNRKYYACIDYLDSLGRYSEISNAGTCASQVK
ncbi:hypothetical protein PS726_00461 [Pseudomonas fluorescens]|nr:hypothetical protein PS726_00461 [Pseudomonas fluorescens]